MVIYAVPLYLIILLPEGKILIYSGVEVAIFRNIVVKNGLKKGVLLFALVALLPLGSVFAQTSTGLGLHLNRSKELKHSGIPKSGEFRLSLGSQMFAYENPEVSSNDSQGRFFSAANVTSESANQSFFNRAELRLKSKTSPARRLSPVITLNNSYEDNAIGFNDSASSGFSIAGGNRKLQIYGEFEQRHTPQILLPSVANNYQTIRASSINSAPGSIDQTESHEKNAALASRYYLEAVYSFKPTLKGKVSFKRSMIDTFESEENLQVEGIVEANHNVLIKAGYNNEVRPEVTEPRSNNDTKIWTEFILKF